MIRSLEGFRRAVISSSVAWALPLPLRGAAVRDFELDGVEEGGEVTELRGTWRGEEAMEWRGEATE